MKHILIINGHPRKDSFNSALTETYKTAAEKTGASVKIINVTDLKFEPFQTEFKKYEAPDAILKSREMIEEAEHIVWVYPIWWYFMPALLKAFIEQTFMSGFGFKYLKSKNRVKWEKLLTGKTCSIISTMDAPPWYYKIIIKDPTSKMLKASMAYCGIKFKSRMYFGSVKISSEEQRKSWLKKVETYGSKYK